MIGRNAEDLRKGSVQIEGGAVFCEFHESSTNLLYFKLGVVFRF